ncbi:hypothetical protein N7489_003083 [Penicillium chrysogenum]|uniref:Uncharacterized protein n=1 Tax=Penicillium chrysogenum TaxID=5076 RepID=A0ABQ8W7I9_PENCH|nr:uncharacterized protein N7489_003083 [Penicillium chrysogenum]KAJ5252673.1 hypothetical protein N7489_003083 [Penicillium chrysogenum]KAJ5254174.1 hypothetical protein N7524_011354 [Penicillium chrysogenum]KAJ5259910.1 hypothetical protein N7505_009291 [Penicillium chrysogenum]KAJ6142177.1 hypothetical protein N7497_011276 [Penicillium chrysogenum]
MKATVLHVSGNNEVEEEIDMKKLTRGNGELDVKYDELPWENTPWLNLLGYSKSGSLNMFIASMIMIGNSFSKASLILDGVPKSQQHDTTHPFRHN